MNSRQQNPLLITYINVLDSDQEYRYAYLYDNDGRKVLETKYVSSDHVWLKSSQTEWQYQNGNCVSQREFVFESGKWNSIYIIRNNYDNASILSETHSRIESGAETNVRSVVFQYENTQLMQRTEFVWESDRWQIDFSESMFRHSSGRVDSTLIAMYDSELVTKQILVRYTYDEADKMVSQLTLQKNEGADWVNDELVQWFYVPGTSNVLQVRAKKWLQAMQQWENTRMTENIYDNGELVSEIYSHWESIFWKANSKYDFKYDAKGNVINRTLSFPIYKEWRTVVGVNYSDFQDSKANRMESVLGFWGGNEGELVSSHIPFYFNDEIAVKKGKQIELNYTPLIVTNPTGVHSKSLQSIDVYPNPSDGIFYFDSMNYDVVSWEVLSLNGVVLKSYVQNFKTGVIDITELPPGMYMLQVHTTQGRLTQKLVRK